MVEYKNQETIVKAFSLIMDKIPHNLIFKAKRTQYWDFTIAPLLKEKKMEERVFLMDDNFSESQMNWLYSKADLFVNASTMEGFGFTPIEAAINKTKVLTTEVTALKETTMDLLNYYQNPYDEHELAHKMLLLLNEGLNESKLIMIAKTFKKIYSPKRQADLFVNCFKNIVYV